MPERPAEAQSAMWVQRTTAAIARGDRPALAELYEEWFDRCYGLARTLTGRDESFCLDVVQDTMLRVIRSLRPMATYGELSAWMTRATHSAALDLLRRESRRGRREAARGRAGSEQATQADERIAWLLARIKDLPAADGDLVALRFGRARSLEAVGTAAGISGDAAHGRIRRTLMRLRRWAKEDSHES